MGHIMAYIGFKLLDIFVKPSDLFRKTMGYYWAKTIGYIMGYIRQNYMI